MRRAVQIPSKILKKPVLDNLKLVDFVVLCIDQVHSACDAGIEGVNGAKDFHRSFGIGNRGAHKRFFHWSHLIGSVARAEVPA